MNERPAALSKLRPSGLDGALLLEIVAFDGEPSPSAPIVFRRRPRSHFPAGPGGDRTWSMWNSKYAGRPAGVTSADGRVRMMLNGRSVDARAVVEELLAALNGNGLASGGTSPGTPDSGGTSPDPAVVSSEGANGGGTSPGTPDSGGTSSEEPNGGEYGGYEEIGDGPLGRAILAASRKTGLALADLTAMRRDPYRRDTTSGHRNGRWFKLWWERYGAPRLLHLRGLFYALIMHVNEDGSVGVKKPDGANLLNTEDDYNAIGNLSQDARWLGYVPFESIPDERNAEPLVRKYAEREAAEAAVVVKALEHAGVDPNAIGVYPATDNFDARQPYRLVLFGEKTSLAIIINPISHEYQADLYLETGQISDRHLYEIARDAWVDGRKLVVVTVSDFDPAGYWDMPIAIARKLMAHRDREFGSLEFVVVPAALNEAQVRSDPPLPSTPLKRMGEPGREKMLPGSDRVEEWLGAYGGLEQTEVDAAIAIKPDELSGWIRAALNPWFDYGLADRVEAAKAEWVERAQAALDAHVDHARVDRLKVRARRATVELTWVNELLEQERATAAEEAELPEPEVPEPDADALAAAQEEARAAILINSDMSFADATRRLRAHAPGREKLRRWRPKPR